MTPQSDRICWKQTLFNPHATAEWAVEPNIEAIRDTLSKLLPSANIEIRFLAEGGFNKVYDAKVDDEDLIVRVALPVDPDWKTEAEIETMNWVRDKTDIPIPVPLAYDASEDNTIGFAWILMTKVPGQPMNYLWHSLAFSQLLQLAQKLAEHCACLFRNQLKGIGSLTKSTDSSDLRETSKYPKVTPEGRAMGLSGTLVQQFTASQRPQVGQIVSPVFFWARNLERDIHRGPFVSSHDWLKARLELNEHSCLSTLEKASNPTYKEHNQVEVEAAKKGLALVRKLQSLLPRVFPLPDHDAGPEATVLVHEDLARRNLLLNSDGELSSILDWEMIATLPLWKACDYPYLMQGPTRHEEPNIEDYECNEDGEVDTCYWDDLWVHKRTVLRSAFLQDMQDLEPEWFNIHEQSQTKRDFDIAVRDCEIGWYEGFINEWIDGFTDEGFTVSLEVLRDRL